jgi:hypothetical protein
VPRALGLGAKPTHEPWCDRNRTSRQRCNENARPQVQNDSRRAGIAVAQDETRAGHLVIRRKPGFQNHVGQWHVILDGKDIGTLERGQERRFEVAAGGHRVLVKIVVWLGVLSTNAIEFAGNEGEVFLACGRNVFDMLWEAAIFPSRPRYRLVRLTRLGNE